MSAQLAWLVPGRIVCCRISDPVNPATLRDMSRDILEYLNAGHEPGVHFLVELEARQRATSLAVARDILAPVLSHPYLGWITMYGLKNEFIRALADTMLRAMRKQFHFAASREAAITFLLNADPTLPDLRRLPSPLVQRKG